MLKFVNLTSAMDFITVQVGSEEKQISGLTRKTTCIDVLQALIKERQTAMAESGSNNGSNEVVQTTKDQDTTAEPFFPLDKSPREIAHGYVIVETWRGNENTLSPRTQILKTWHAWGNEQKYVKFALRQSNRRIRYRDTSHKHSGEHHHHHGGKRDYRHNISHGQRRRIRRSMMRYQQAVLMQRANMMEGKETTADSKSADDKNSQSQNTEIIFSLSEEQFVDGVLTGPDCLLYNAKFARSALGDSDLASEHCAYRRSRIHHRRRSSVIQEADVKELTTETTTYTRRSSVQHAPRKHRRRSTSRGRVIKQRDLLRHHQRMLATGEVSTATTDSNDGDADDEKSIMAASSNVPDTSGGQRFLRQQIANTSVHQLPSNDESYMSGATSTSTTTTGTDSSCGTTTCSETSAGSSLSGTSSSETSSSSTDYFNTEQFLAKRAAEAAAEAAAKAAANEKAAKQSGAVKLFKKVASQSLLSSFRKKKRAPAHISNSVSTSVSSNRQKSSPAVKCKVHDGGDKTTSSTATETSKRNNLQQQQNLDVISTWAKREQPSRSGDIVKNNSPQQLKPLLPVLESEQGDDEVKCEKHEEENNNDTSPLLQHADESEEGDGGGTIEEWRVIVSSRAQLLCDRMRAERKVDLEIERTNAEINKCKAQQQHLAAQDTDQDHTATDEADGTCIRTCDDKNMLSTYIEWCQKIIDKQMQIEECKRRHEILLQEMEDERWTDGNHKTARDTDDSKAIRFSDETYDFKTCESSEDDDEEDDDEEERLEQLQVSSCQQHDLQDAASSKLKAVNEEEEEELSGDDDKDVDQMLSKMESSWYLHLRLTTEIDNLEYRNLEKQRLIESKRDRVVQLVREMSSSSEGISPELWKEYGGMLMAYDTQLSLQHHYFDACRSSLASEVMPPLPTTCNDSLQLELTPPPTTAGPSMNQAISPWMWCEHCKLELQEQQRLGHEGTIIPKHSYTHDQLPPSLSQLPLPAPLEISPSKPGRSQLLPMYPVPICNDSDYEDLDIATSLTSTSHHHQSNFTESSANSTDESVTPALSSLHRPNVAASNNEIRNYQKYLVEEPIQSSNASTDDSGNASAGSISSFTSADGCGGDTASRSGSCDGESPPPSSGNGQDSTNPFCREEHRRSSWKSRFPFSSHQKNTSVVGMPSKLKLSRPKTPLHLHKKFNQQQQQQQQLQTGNIYSPTNDKQLASEKSCGPHLSGNKQHHHQQQLMQSAMRVSNKSYYNNELAKKGHRAFITSTAASANEMARRPTVAPLRTLNHNLVRAAPGMGVNLISGGKYYTKGPYYAPPPFNELMLPLQFPIHDRRMVKMQLNDRRPVISDNDSDTGLSSLHSTDSADLFMYSETLV